MGSATALPPLFALTFAFTYGLRLVLGALFAYGLRLVLGALFTFAYDCSSALLGSTILACSTRYFAAL